MPVFSAVTMRGKIPVGRTTFTPFVGAFVMARKSSSPTAGEAYGTFTVPTAQAGYLGTYTCFSKTNVGFRLVEYLEGFV